LLRIRCSSEDDGNTNRRKHEYQAARPLLFCQRAEDNAFHLQKV